MMRNDLMPPQGGRRPVLIQNGNIGMICALSLLSLSLSSVCNVCCDAWTISSNSVSSNTQQKKVLSSFQDPSHHRLMMTTTTTTTITKGRASSRLQMYDDFEEEETEYSSSSSSSSSSNWSSSSGNDSTRSEKDEKEAMKEKRTEVLKALRNSFYNTASSSSINTLAHEMEEECKQNDTLNTDECILLDTDSPDAIFEPSTTCHYDKATGKVMNLPLWRVQWTELPGRTNVLSIHEAMYTNMFEEILHSEPPWYVGHLFLPEGSESVHLHDEDNDPILDLHTWKQEKDDIEEYTAVVEEEKAAVLGTLLRITDYRRMEDGKLLLMVQALHRFVVTDVVQTLPFGIGHVQMLPDAEETLATAQTPTEKQEEKEEMLITMAAASEETIGSSRIRAVQSSLDEWLDYEFDDTKLPLKQMDYMPITEIIGTSLIKLIPFASYSSTVKVSDKETKKQAEISTTESSVKEEGDSNTTQKTHPALEQQLLKCGVLKGPSLLQQDALMHLSLQELETRLWFALDEYAKETRKPIPLVLLGLMPHGIRWPKKFVLLSVVRAIELQIKTKTMDDSSFIRISKHYPALRRQQRLSYHAAQLLENPSDSEEKNKFRQQLLSMPSIKERLAFLLQKFECQDHAFE